MFAADRAVQDVARYARLDGGSFDAELVFTARVLGATWRRLADAVGRPLVGARLELRELLDRHAAELDRLILHSHGRLMVAEPTSTGGRVATVLVTLPAEQYWRPSRRAGRVGSASSAL